LRNLVQTTVGLVLERTERNGCPRREWRKRRRAASYRLSITVVIMEEGMDAPRREWRKRMRKEKLAVKV